MYGSLSGALAARQIRFDRDTYEATAEGVIEGEDRKIRVTEIKMHYRLAVPADQKEAAERALAVHPQGCPAHRSVEGAIRVTWDADLTTF